MENKNGAALDDNALENASGGYIYHNRGDNKYYSVDNKGNIDWSSGRRDRRKVEDYNDEHNISNREVDIHQIGQLKRGQNPFSHPHHHHGPHYGPHY